jgi:phosphoribosylformylglycinamidine cyclo-ligase
MALTYGNSGVDYGPLDAFKRACQREAAATVSLLAAQGMNEPAAIRGESAYLIETPDEFLAHVEEGLGTKNLVADAVLDLTGQSFYAHIGIDLVATIVNDLVTTGALPISLAMHAAVGDAAWFAQGTKGADLASGFAAGCLKSGAVWGGGETPALKGIVNEKTIVLGGSALGRIKPKSQRIAGDLAEGDVIILLASSGVQTNGLTLCRALVERLEHGYLTKMDDGRAYGEALLDASVIYVPFITACHRHRVRLKYAAHITGHGWRKLMRLDRPFVYRIHDIGQVPEIFKFIQGRGPVDRIEAYATFNMGAGFAAYVSPADANGCLSAASEAGIKAWLAGTVCKNEDRKAVEIEPLGIVFEADSLRVR